MLEAAFQEDLGDLILTACWTPQHKISFYNELEEIANRHNGQIKYIQLMCDIEKLLDRVGDDSRKLTKKINKREKLKEVLGETDFFTVLPYRESLVINNTHLSPKEVVDKIENYID